MTLLQAIDALPPPTEILNFKAMYSQNRETYKQAIDSTGFSVRCEKKHLAHPSSEQQCKILIMIITVLFECSKPKQRNLQRNKIKRHELKKARAVFKKADSLKSEDKEVLNLDFGLRKGDHDKSSL